MTGMIFNRFQRQWLHSSFQGPASMETAKQNRLARRQSHIGALVWAPHGWGWGQRCLTGNLWRSKRLRKPHPVCEYGFPFSLPVMVKPRDLIHTSCHRQRQQAQLHSCSLNDPFKGWKQNLGLVDSLFCLRQLVHTKQPKNHCWIHIVGKRYMSSLQHCLKPSRISQPGHQRN